MEYEMLKRLVKDAPDIMHGRMFPDDRYTFTCPRCRCHVIYDWRLARDERTQLFVVCGTCYKLYAWPKWRSFSDSFARLSDKEEIERAIRALAG